MLFFVAWSCSCQILKWQKFWEKKTVVVGGGGEVEERFHVMPTHVKIVGYWMLTLIVWPWLALIWSFPDKGLFLSVNLCLSFSSTTFFTWGSQYPENLGNFKTASTSTKPDCLKKKFCFFEGDIYCSFVGSREHN